MKVLFVIDGMLPDTINGVSSHVNMLCAPLLKYCDVTFLDISAPASIPYVGNNNYHVVRLPEITRSLKLPEHPPVG